MQSVRQLLLFDFDIRNCLFHIKLITIELSIPHNNTRQLYRAYRNLLNVREVLPYLETFLFINLSLFVRYLLHFLFPFLVLLKLLLFPFDFCLINYLRFFLLFCRGFFTKVFDSCTSRERRGLSRGIETAAISIKRSHFYFKLRSSWMLRIWVIKNNRALASGNFT